uniref:Acetyl-coenzyme A carboxylase carboxyl transferase subunit beta, chloroplastic n=1 Tax=Trithuria inconspicua TaxID=405043 RepID=M1WU47_9MAGN|nr:AccD [Trithuria inconspicua]CCJ32526.1 AccD [Trithuria inconspicua]
MERRWLNSIWSNPNQYLEYNGCGLSKLMVNRGPIGHSSEGEEQILNNNDKTIPSWWGGFIFSESNVDPLFGFAEILSLISGEVRDSNGDSYYIYFDIENQIFDVHIENSDLTPNREDKSSDPYYERYIYDTEYSWKDHVNDCIINYLRSETNNINLSSWILKISKIFGQNYITSYIYSQSRGGSRGIFNQKSGLSKSDSEGISHLQSDSEGTSDCDQNEKPSYAHLWVLCENCNILNYKKSLRSNMSICEYCEYHLAMSSSDRIDLLIDPGTFHPMDENMILDPLFFDMFDSEEESDKVDYEMKTDLTEDEDIFPMEEPSEESDNVDYEMETYFNEADYMFPEDIFPMEEPSEESNEVDSEMGTDLTEDEDIFPMEDPWDDSSEELLARRQCVAIVRYILVHEKIVLTCQKLNKAIIQLLQNGIPQEDPIEFDFEEESYEDRIHSYQLETGLTEAVQTGIGQLNGIRTAIGVMDFEFIAGSMGSVVGEKITRLIEYATNESLPLIIVCASGGARMQEGSLSLMQMAKIAAALNDYQSKKESFYVSILTSPTTGGVTASFGMLGDIIIAEPDATIAFAGKRVIEDILKTPVPEDSQVAEYLFPMGLFDTMVPRNLLKGVLTELFQFHGFFP